MSHRRIHRITAVSSAALTVFLAACTKDKRAEDTGPSGRASEAVATMNPDPAQNTYAPELGVTIASAFKTPGGTYYQDVAPGTGTVSITGRRAKVRYTGRLANGKQFDAGEYEFTPGSGDVIPGWDDGVVGMKVGGKRKLIIPADRGYGAQGSPPDIPPNAVLVFDVELLSVT